VIYDYFSRTDRVSVSVFAYFLAQKVRPAAGKELSEYNIGYSKTGYFSSTQDIDI